MTSWKLSTAVLVLACSFPMTAGASYTRIVSFGDSLSDTGNVFAATGSPPAPYYQGHYSNGPIWLEILATRLGLPAPTPSLLGGNDNAWGGAETTLTGNSIQGTPNIGTQIAGYLAGHTLTGQDLITVWGGGNDFLFGGQTNPAVSVNNLGAEITTLALAGGKTFLVPNLPLLGQVPGTAGLPQAQRDGLDQLTQGFNALLAAKTAALRASLGVTIYQGDVASLFANAKANPSAYGFTNTTTGAFNDKVYTGAGYLFWDDEHGTTAANRLVANVAFAAVPEPSSVVLLGLAGLALLAPGVRAWKRERAA